MKIDKKDLVGFLKKIRMTGGEQITECVFNFEENGLKICANSPSNVSRSSGILKSTAFKEYSKIEPIGINQLSEFINVINRFDGEITLTVEGNLLNVKGKGKKVDIELVDTSFISTDIKEPEMKFIDTFSIDSKRIKEIFSDVKVNTDTQITFETKEGKILVSNTGKYKFQHAIECKTCSGGAKSKYGQPFIDSITELDSDLEISIANDYPAKIIEKTDKSVVTIIVAPRLIDE